LGLGRKATLVKEKKKDVINDGTCKAHTARAGKSNLQKKKTTGEEKNQKGAESERPLSLRKKERALQKKRRKTAP